MSLQEKFEKIQADFSNLDPENIGAWPLAVKLVCWVLAALLVIILSYQFVLKGEQELLDSEIQKEASLRSEFQDRVREAANLDAYRVQMKEMKESFDALLLQLPKDTEVPGLLDDISEKGNGSGLNFNSIDLLPEKKAEFYIELPISIKVTGGYHDFGTFISGVAGLPRIVTLHDFVIEPVNKASEPGKGVSDSGGRDSEELSMLITAKTYRYKSTSDVEDDAAKGGAQPKPAVAGGDNAKGAGK